MFPGGAVRSDQYRLTLQCRSGHIDALDCGAVRSDQYRLTRRTEYPSIVQHNVAPSEAINIG